MELLTFFFFLQKNIILGLNGVIGIELNEQEISSLISENEHQFKRIDFGFINACCWRFSVIFMFGMVNHSNWFIDFVNQNTNKGKNCRGLYKPTSF